MNCKNCGKEMPNGARFCISCGAEHDSNGQLIIKKENIDYNKTMMANDMPQNKKIDYNKTMMANDIPQNNKVDYNKTMMANDIVPEKMSNNNVNVKVGNSLKINANKKSAKTNKKNSPIVIVVCLIVIFAGIISFIFSSKKSNIKVENNNIEQTEVIVETTTIGNEVSDFNSSDGYWSKDAEFFYRDGTIQKNQWIGDYYVGNDGRKLKNQLIDDDYYVDATGKKIKNEWYKFTKNVGGTIVTIWYYFGEDGMKLKDTLTPDGYYVDKDGIYMPGEHDSPNSKVYIPNNN